MQGRDSLPVRVRLPDLALRADLRGVFHRWGCVTYEVSDDAVEVIVPDAPAERQGRCELRLYLETWRAHHPGLELELLDGSEWIALESTLHALPDRRTSLCARKLGLALKGL